jgi:hypothetical protein
MSLSILLKDLQFAVQAAINVEGQLKDKKFLHDLEVVANSAKKGFTDATCDAIHRLHITKPSIDTVKELVQGIPDALSFKSDYDQLPIQAAVWYMDALKYIPILAKEGIEHNVGDRGMRGGLLAEDPEDRDNYCNSLELIAATDMDDPSNPMPADTACLDVLKELRKDNILLEADIKERSLLFWSCRPQSKMRFEYLAEWDPDCLMTGTFNNMPISHAIIENSKDITSFTVYFQTALQHHPQHLGMLFQKNRSGKTLFERAIEKHGEDSIFNIIKHYIPTDTKLPILHHVVRDAPKYTNIFSIRYLSAMYLRDENGRTIKQAIITSGSKTLKNDAMFFGMMTDDEIAELDPVTKQYPFLTCATGESSDLSTVYALLSRNPSLLEKYIEQTTDEFAEEARSRKRKRDGDADNEGDNDSDVDE